jgi:hypothetical protein
MQVQAQDERRSTRKKVLLAATIKHDAGATRIRLLDLSSHGALIAGDDIPRADSAVTLHCGKQSVGGRVAWVDDSQAGLSFNQGVSSSAFSPISGGSSQFVFDRASKANPRRPGFRGDQLSAEERFFLNQIMSDHHQIVGPPTNRG